ncbi:MAG: tetratricopeptide repeat protein [Candidatus Krumholzibacteria bacterium]|nr:tetratricopeptide repeat protein [Candidatus Krumholzibacteria bacterium]MDP6668480.1 tetratricopeptide repeat protein [Candidatus Krumholzibacteria bacterium]MDP6797374.1 tetratricopeptide repeat protein [Candidatus Krumholzibacteria bacterium]MDP7021573.1 tetratricopeptide repeat protein [Candidatus Krumholzibacteria bacterium]
MKGLLLLLVLAVSFSAQADTASDLYRLSYTQENAGEYLNAMETMDTLRELGEGGYFVEMRLGWLLYLCGRYSESAAYYRRAAERESASVEALLGRTLPLMAQRQWLDVIESCKAVLERDPGNYTALSRMASAQYQLGRYPQSETSYRKLLSLYPSDQDLHSGLGWALLMMGDKEEARKEFEGILRVSPDHLSAAQGLRALD